eukprot:jgi/Mesvir1/428/Mv11310-RA.1
MSSLSALKAQSKSRDQEEKRIQDRRRSALVIILRHLLDSGYVDSVEKLQAESGVSLSKYDVADNIDMATIVQEFEEYHELKFGRKPKLIRKNAGGDDELPPMPNGGAAAKKPARGNSGSGKSRFPSIAGAEGGGGGGGGGSGGSNPEARNSPARKPSMKKGAPEGPEDGDFAGLDVVGVQAKPGKKPSKEGEQDNPEDYFEHRLLKPMPDYGNAELRELAASITRDIYVESPNVRWDSISGLEEAKKLIKEAVVMPHRYPQFFKGILTPWKGILLYGPPGTGKTMLAKAVATECRTTFFNISASSIISKWRGDSEKLVRVLFELARYHAPSTIFLDELDALMSARGEGAGEHEASRRMKTELLVQMDGLAKSSELVFLLGATNLPWELDQAMLRRLEKRILVPLPNLEARTKLFAELLASASGLEPGLSFHNMGERTEGYSGSDIYLVCKEAAMMPLRRVMASIERDELPLDAEPKLGPITLQDVERALRTTKPSASMSSAKYEKFHKEQGTQLQDAEC